MLNNWCCCAQTPFAALFGGEELGATAADSDSESVGSGYDPYKRVARTPAQITEQIAKWVPLLNPRIKELWPRGHQDPRFEAVMRELLENTDARDDPITNAYDHVCTPWYGAVGVDDSAAVIRLRGGGDGEEPNLSYVVRLLAFMFADDATFELLQQHGGEGPLPMSCDNVRCVNIQHCIVPD